MALSLQLPQHRLEAILSHYDAAAHRLMSAVLLFMWLLTILYGAVNAEWGLAVVLGGLIAAAGLGMTELLRHPAWTPITVAVVLMLQVSLQVHLLEGMIEAHFGYFAMLAVLLVYFRILPLLAAAGAAAVLHLVMHFLQHAGYPVMLFPPGQHSIGIVLFHALYVVLETVFLVILVVIGRPLMELARGVVQRTEAMVDEQEQILLNPEDSESDNPIMQRLDRVLTLIGRSISEVRVQSAEAHRHLQALQANTETSSSQAGQVAERVHQIDQSMRDMNESFRQVAHQTQTAAERAGQAAEGWQGVGAQMDDTDTTIRDLAAILNDASQAVQSLADDCSQVSKTLSEIESIAEQTNLLALNAAIEAARAGDHGRGFAVVADEVRQLSQRSRESTHNSAEVIGRLLTGAESASQAMQASQERVEQTVAKSETLQQAMAEIRGAIEAINEINQQIAVAAEQQSHVATEIAGQVDQISTSVNEQQGIRTENRTRLTELTSGFEALERSISRFRDH